MESIVHNTNWQKDLNHAIKTTMSLFRSFGVGDAMAIPEVISKDIDDKFSTYYRFLEVLFDETLLDAELSFSAEKAGNTNDVYLDCALRKKQKAINKRRFNGILNDALLFCLMSDKYGVCFTDAVRALLDQSYSHSAFLFEFYDTVMFQTRNHYLNQEKR